MPACKVCGEWFAKTNPHEELCLKCECALSRLSSYATRVVRCKDCKYYKESRVLAPNKFCFRLKHPTEPGKIGYNFAGNDFCSRGVRRNEGADNG